MPWWVWLILALFMAAMIVVGCIYALRRGFAALQTVSNTASQVGNRIARMGEPVEASAPEAPFFTQPLAVSLEYYEAAQLKVAQRDKAKHERHMRVWQRWNRERIKVPDFINETDE